MEQSSLHAQYSDLWRIAFAESEKYSIIHQTVKHDDGAVDAYTVKIRMYKALETKLREMVLLSEPVADEFYHEPQIRLMDCDRYRLRAHSIN
jgi:hypothetical protein